MKVTSYLVPFFLRDGRPRSNADRVSGHVQSSFSLPSRLTKPCSVPNSGIPPSRLPSPGPLRVGFSLRRRRCSSGRAGARAAPRSEQQPRPSLRLPSRRRSRSMEPGSLATFSPFGSGLSSHPAGLTEHAPVRGQGAGWKPSEKVASPRPAA